MIVIGVDPGARHTGLAAVDVGDHGTARHHLDSSTITRQDANPTTSPDPAYLVHVIADLMALVDKWRADLIAVEGVLPPNPHLGITNPDSIIAAGMVYGAVISRGYGAPLVIVRPGSNGSQALITYPDALITTHEKRKPGWERRAAGKGALNHQRSAYDVAVQGWKLRPLAHATPYTF